jgi:aminoglycoside N3'-acetyltransferase
MDKTREVNEMDIRPVTEQEIKNGFEQLGLHAGDTVEVHSSLSSFGKVEGGADAVINALIATVGEDGNIVMSAYPLTAPVELTDEEKTKGIQWKAKVLPEDSQERTGMGIIVDTFKRRPDVVTGHGIHRVAAWGKDKEVHQKGYRQLVENGGLVLLLGVGIDRVSSMHLAERDIPIPQDIEKLNEVPEELLRDYPSDDWAIGYGVGTPEDGWSKVYQKADNLGLIKHLKIGNADCHLFKAKDVINIYAEWRKNDPYGLVGLPKPNED